MSSSSYLRGPPIVRVRVECILIELHQRKENNEMDGVCALQVLPKRDHKNNKNHLRYFRTFLCSLAAAIRI